MILGKTNLSEWANFRSTHSTSGWSGRGGQTKNPYALDRNPSGSSSGSGAAIAANLARGRRSAPKPTARSSRRRTTTALVGIKPTLGLVSRTRHRPDRAQPGHRRARWRAPSPTPRCCSARWPAPIRDDPATTGRDDRGASRLHAVPRSPNGLQGRAHRRRPQQVLFGYSPAADRARRSGDRGDEAAGRGDRRSRRTSRRSASSTTASSRCCSTSSRPT